MRLNHVSYDMPYSEPCIHACQRLHRVALNTIKVPVPVRVSWHATDLHTVLGSSVERLLHLLQVRVSAQGAACNRIRCEPMPRLSSDACTGD